AAESEISTSLASDKSILRVACGGRGGGFLGNNRPHHCAGRIFSGAHRSGSKNRSEGAGSMLAWGESGGFEIGQRTNASDQRNGAGNIKRSPHRCNRWNRDVCLCNNGEKPVGFAAGCRGVPRYHHQLLS